MVSIPVCIISSDVGTVANLQKENLKIAPEDIEIISKLKSDGLGSIYKGVWTRNEGKLNVAIKKIRSREPEVIKDIVHEVEIMENICCPNISAIYGACLISPKEVWLVLELADGNLHDYISSTPLTYIQQLSFALQAAKALNYIHTLPTPVIHRDITSENILVQNKRKLLLSGFGLAKTFSHVTHQTESFGSIRWAAPEVFDDISKTWSEKSDIYSIGMVFYELMSGKLPYHEEEWNFDKIMNKIKGGKRPKIPKQCPKEFRNVIKRCWNANPKLRPTAKELAALIEECQTKSAPILSTLTGEKKPGIWLCVQ